MVADPLSLSISGSEVAATVTLNSQIVDDQAFCGDAEGNVVDPITIDLKEVHYAVRWTEGLISSELEAGVRKRK